MCVSKEVWTWLEAVRLSKEFMCGPIWGTALVPQIGPYLNSLDSSVQFVTKKSAKGSFYHNSVQ